MTRNPPRWLLAAGLLLAVPAAAQTLGKGGSVATGGAGPDATSNASGQLERCDAPKGTLAVIEPVSQVQANLQRYGLGSPTGVLRMLVQQSNCFQVVERGVGMRGMLAERGLGYSGELQNNQNVGKGQMVAADFILTPSVVFSENNAGGIGGTLGGIIGGGSGRAIAGLAGGVKFKQAETSMVLADTRSGIQVASAQGSAEKADFALGGSALGRVSAAGGGYGNTNEGKLIVASFMDNWNNIVRNVRHQPSLVQPRAGEASQRNAAESVRANAFAPGDVVFPKIAGVRVLRQPQEGAPEVQVLGRNDEVLLNGEEMNGYVKVTTARGEGWIKAILLGRR